MKYSTKHWSKHRIDYLQHTYKRLMKCDILALVKIHNLYSKDKASYEVLETISLLTHSEKLESWQTAIIKDVIYILNIVLITKVKKAKDVCKER